MDQPDLRIELVRVPVPIKALKHINTYLIEGDDEKFLIDTGTPVEETIEFLRAGLRNLGLDFSDLDGVIVTHMHIDHIGNAGLIQKEADVPVYMGFEEFKFVEYFVLAKEETYRRIGDFFISQGVPTETARIMLERHPALLRRRHYEFIEELEFLDDGDRLQVGSVKLEAVETPGHSPHHMCFYVEDHNVLFSGDHILYDITPNISFPASDDDDPLGNYIKSLDKISQYEAEVVKPGHRDQLDTLKNRVLELKLHHLNRLLEVVKILENGPLSAYETASRMTWDVNFPWEDFPPHQIFFAVSETVAHIRFLEFRGYVDSLNEDGLIKYSFDGDIQELKLSLKKELGLSDQ